MNRTKRIFIIIIAVAVFTAGAVFYNTQIQTPAEPPTPPTSSQKQKEEISLKIDFGDNQKTFTTQYQKGVTAYDFLKKTAQKKEIVLKTKEYDFGIMITQIEKKENTKNGKSWIFYVNGEMAKEAVNKINLKPGDKVKFKYEENPF